MLDRARLAALALAAAAAALASAGCPSLDALECHGDACADGAAGDAQASDGGGTDGADGGDGAVSPSGIFCGGGTACAPGSQECCVAPGGSTSCTSTSNCGGGTDIFCDDPSQCPGGGTCWICINQQGFQGTSCNYQSDIVNQDHCDATNALVLCHGSTQCEGGTTCKPLVVPELGSSWFMACQP